MSCSTVVSAGALSLSQCRHDKDSEAIERLSRLDRDILLALLIAALRSQLASRLRIAIGTLMARIDNA